MLRAWKRRLAVAAATGAVAGALALAGFAAAAPAGASATGQIMTFNGNHYELNSPNFNIGTALTFSGSAARTICGPAVGDPPTTLRLCGSNAPANRCVVADQSGNYIVHIEACNAVGSLWTNEDNGDGSRYFVNNHYTTRVLAGDNFDNDPAVAEPLGATGIYYRMFPLA